MKATHVLLLFLLLNGAEINALDENAPPPEIISAYKDNFLYYGQKGDEEDVSSMFRLGLKGELTPVFGEKTRTVYFYYRMTGYWDTKAESGPFRDINHNPGLFVRISEEGQYFRTLANKVNARYIDAGVEHVSNGLDDSSTGPGGIGQNRSRSVHHAWFIESTFSWFDEYLIVEPKFWFPKDLEENNADLEDYWGNVWTTTSIGDCYEISTKGDPFYKGNVELKWHFYRLPWNSDVSFTFHGFSGYGDGLLDYDVENTWVRFGITFSQYNEIRRKRKDKNKGFCLY